MKRIGLAGLMVYALLLLAVQGASAQDGSPSCPGGSAYDLTGHGCVTGYVNAPTAVNSIAPKATGLAVVATVASQDPTMDWISSQERNANVVAAGLAKVAPAVDPKQGLPGCPWGYYYNPITHDYVLVCVSQPADNTAALKPAGLAASVPVVAPEQGSRCMSYAGPNYSVCVVASSGASAAAKPAGLAAPAQERPVDCDTGGNPNRLACQY
jgi:hypothetical protein